MPPLEQAVMMRNADLIEKLIKEGADVNDRDFMGGTALCVAAAQGFNEIISLLLKNHADIDKAAWIGGTPLQVAANEGQLAALVMLETNGASVNCFSQGTSPIHDAAFNGYTQIVEFLLNHGANVNARTIPKSAEDRKTWDSLKQIVSPSYKISSYADTPGATPLHYAVVGEQPAVVSLLLKKGADPKIQDTDGNTPLSLAEARHLEAIINLLLQGSGK
jgi:hypothetical protein